MTSIFYKTVYKTSWRLKLIDGTIINYDHIVSTLCLDIARFNTFNLKLVDI